MTDQGTTASDTKATPARRVLLQRRRRRLAPVELDLRTPAGRALPY